MRRSGWQTDLSKQNVAGLLTPRYSLSTLSTDSADECRSPLRYTEFQPLCYREISISSAEEIKRVGRCRQLLSFGSQRMTAVVEILALLVRKDCRGSGRQPCLLPPR